MSVNALWTQLNSPVLNISDDTAGRYLVQFTSGQNKGAVRRLTRINNGMAEWLTPLMTLAPGDQFEILQSATARNDGGDDAFFYSLMGR
jgi:hypothetical protein